MRKFLYNKKNLIILIFALFIGLSALTYLVMYTNVSSAASPGDLIKIKFVSSIYYLDSDDKRHAFPDETTYFSWYNNFSKVITISPSEMASYRLSKNVTIRAGTKLVKIKTNTKVYAVELGGILKWIPDETTASTLYGADWSKKVVDVPVSFFSNYTVSDDQISATAYPEGSLVAWPDSSEVFYISANNQARKITTEVAFNANRFNLENVIRAPNTIPKPATKTEITKVDIKLINTVADAPLSIPNIDSDNDGISDWEETEVYNTDPTNPDSDGDSYFDGAEVETGYNPNGIGKMKLLSIAPAPIPTPTPAPTPTPTPTPTLIIPTNQCPEGTSCDDNNLCTINDICSHGICRGSLITCHDDNSCTNDICNASTGQCVYTPNTNYCDDFNICTNNDRCLNGTCQGTSVGCANNDNCCPATCVSANDNDCQAPDQCIGNSNCNDSNSCTQDICSGAPKTCSNPPIIICSNDDGCCPAGCNNINDNDCLLPDQCVTDTDCDDSDSCTQDTCSDTSKTCSNSPTTACSNDDGCCPAGCNNINDNDCEAVIPPPEIDETLQ